MLARAQEWWDEVRSSWWFVPLVMGVAAILLSFVTTLLDANFTDVFEGGFGLYAGGADGSRSILETVAQSLITVAGVAFSIAIVVMTLASSQFGPRVLRTFMRDPINQLTLGTLISTFLFCVLVLRTIRAEDGIDERFIPHLSVTVAILLTIASLAVFVYFIHHAASSIQATHIVSTIGDEIEKAAERLFPGDLGEPASGTTADPPPGPWREVTAERSGYIQVVSARDLLRASSKADVVVELLVGPGSFVLAGTPLFRVAPADRMDDDTAKKIRGAFAIGRERNSRQDIDFLFDELRQICMRALSPTLNDSITAMQCIQQMSVGLALVAQRESPAEARVDDDGRLRVIARTTTVASILESTFWDIRRSLRDNVVGSQRYLRALGSVGAVATRPEDIRALIDECRRVVEDAAPELSDHDRALLREEQRGALEQIDSRATQPRPVRP